METNYELLSFSKEDLKGVYDGDYHHLVDELSEEEMQQIKESAHKGLMSMIDFDDLMKNASEEIMESEIEYYNRVIRGK